MADSITGLIPLAADTVHVTSSANIGAVVHTVNDAEEASSLVESIQALLRAGERAVAEYLIRDLKTLVSDLLTLYTTGAYVRGSASALREALKKRLWELEPERVRRAIEIIEEYCEGNEVGDVSDATVFLSNILELLGYDTASSAELKNIIAEGVTPEEAIHTALVALVVSAGGVAWNDEVKD